MKKKLKGAKFVYLYEIIKRRTDYVCKNLSAIKIVTKNVKDIFSVVIKHL